MKKLLPIIFNAIGSFLMIGVVCLIILAPIYIWMEYNLWFLGSLALYVAFMSIVIAVVSSFSE